MIIQRSDIFDNITAYKWIEDQYSIRVENYHSSLRELIATYSAGGLKIDLKPNATRLQRYESTPSMWVFDDEETGNSFIIFSDCQNKNFWKGTSFEYIHPNKQNLTDAFERLLKFLVS